MEDPASSLDQQHAEDLMRPPAPATPGNQQEQLIEDTEQQAPLPVETSDTDEPSSPIQASVEDSGNSNPTESSLEATIRKYIPDKSELAISLELRETYAYIFGNNTQGSTNVQSDLECIDGYLTQQEAREGPSLLVIQDANIHWAKALCAKYPEALSPEILAGYLIRFDKIPSTYGKTDAIGSYLEKLYPDAGFRVDLSGGFMLVERSDTWQGLENRFNLDFVVGSYHGDTSTHLSAEALDSFSTNKPGTRSDVFERDEQNSWRRISVHLSCIRLAVDFRKTRR
jgi:hypothetical protein